MDSGDYRRLKATCATTDVLARRLPRFHERRFENG
jgi:hypothetical protein